MVETAIYSLWTKPKESNGYLGFNSERTFIESFTLSLYFSKKWFKQVKLVTDLQGKELVEKWGLEFDDINCDLETELKDCDVKYWALGKIWACKIQDEPFIHLDNDVFLFKPLPKSFLEKEAGFQNRESHHNLFHPFYKDMIDFDKRNYSNRPHWYKCLENDFSYNCGIILFNNLNYLDEWWQEAKKHVNYLDKIGGYKDCLWDFPCIIFEQHFVKCICSEMGLDVGLLTDYKTDKNDDPDLIDDDLAIKLGYTHLISTSKKSPITEDRIRMRLSEENIKLNYPI